MNSVFRFVAVLFFVKSGFLSAQISPGELSNAHKNLEGIDNCTKCHTIGKSLSNDNCLNCHGEIRSRIQSKKGYHATVATKQCVDCHKEHHGRNFSIIHFNKAAFDHAQVGFVLENKHASLQCEQCHTSTKIIAKDIRALSAERKMTTMLGLSNECSSCHTDEHKGQFTASCDQCHGTKEWKHALKFSHDKARFQLIGAHTRVECLQCHKRTWANETAIQFVKMEFGSCASCHADPHKGKFKQECSQCHTPASWQQIKGKKFNHALTQFPLKGKHAALKCEQCHAKNKKEKNIAGEIGFKITQFKECRNCHSDAHAKQFDHRSDTGRCESCHTENGFVPATFSIAEHQKSRFVLNGAHGAVPCTKCHLDGQVNAKSTKIFHWTEMPACTTCHVDIHKGQFALRMTNGCETCHTTSSWQELLFTHEKTGFPLRAKHAVIRCSQCHTLNNGVVQYSGIKKECNACHTDQHAGQFAAKGKTECELCHSEKSWRPAQFDHNTRSRFALTGKHAVLPCNQCHKQGTVNGQLTIIYKPLGTTCVDCHPTQ
ncbi:MAG: cytochrome C [Bacteroidota bacterium]